VRVLRKLFIDGSRFSLEKKERESKGKKKERRKNISGIIQKLNLNSLQSSKVMNPNLII